MTRGVPATRWAAIAEGACVAVGSRVLDPSLVSARTNRRLIGFSFRQIVRALAVRNVSDTQCGFKLFRGDAADQLFSLQQVEGYAFDVEILFLAERLGYPVREVALRWRDQPGSKVRVLRDAVRMMWELLKVRWHHRRITLRRQGSARAAHRQVRIDHGWCASRT